MENTWTFAKVAPNLAVNFLAAEAKKETRSVMQNSTEAVLNMWSTDQ